MDDKMTDRQYESQAFIAGTFRESAEKISTTEKEGYYYA